MNYFSSFLKAYLLLSFSLFVLVPSYLIAEQGFCPGFGKDNSEYQCWYGTEGDDRIFVVGDTIVLNGKTIGINKSNENTKITNIFWLLGGNDLIVAGIGANYIHLGEGNDVAYLEQKFWAIDRVYGQEGDDTIYGSEGFDMLEGNDGNDIIWGMGGNDLIVGGEGSDILKGGAGNDQLVIDFSDLEVDGGLGKDEYINNEKIKD